MANLAISAVCNQACAYCFTADQQRQSAGGPAFISTAAFQERIAFLARSGIGEARLMGGEPTLHPQFAELVARATSAGLKIRVFSNGLMPEEALACLEQLPPDACTVLVNVTEPRAAAGPGAPGRRRETLRRLGRRAVPALNIYRTDFRLDFLLPLIAETGCQPAVRLGMAQPCLSGANDYIRANEYRAVAARIARFAPQAGKAGVALDFDCGFVRCAFSDEELAALHAAGARPGWHCGPIADVGVEGRAIYCYPLALLGSLPIGPETDAAGLRAAFETRTRAYRQAGVFPECSTCALKERGECSGGCLAATIRRFRRAEFRVEVRGGPPSIPPMAAAGARPQEGGGERSAARGGGRHAGRGG